MPNSLWPEGMPLPQMVEELDFETILAAKKQRAVTIFTEADFGFDVEDLETDSTIINLQAAAGEELLLRQRINEAVRGQFLPFSIGTDIDYLGGFHEITRMIDESDERYLARILKKNAAGRLGGNDPHYELVAMTADLRVADAKAYRIGRDPTIYVAIISSDNDGVPSAELLNIVDTALQLDAIRWTSGTVIVHAAARQVTNIAAKVWLLPSAPVSILTEMEAALRDAWADIMKLGRDVQETWLKAKLYRLGVHSIEITAPSGGRIVPNTEVAVLGDITLSYAGRDY